MEFPQILPESPYATLVDSRKPKFKVHSNRGHLLLTFKGRSESKPWLGEPLRLVEDIGFFINSSGWLLVKVFREGTPYDEIRDFIIQSEKDIGAR